MKDNAFEEESTPTNPVLFIHFKEKRQGFYCYYIYASAEETCKPNEIVYLTKNIEGKHILKSSLDTLKKHYSYAGNGPLS